MKKPQPEPTRLNRREFVKGSLATAGATFTAAHAGAQSSPRTGGPSQWLTLDDFARPDSPDIGDYWETLNPGYWKIESQRLRRRLKNYGERAVPIQFPWDWGLIRANPEILEDALVRLRANPEERAKLPAQIDVNHLSDELLAKLFPELDYQKDPSLPEGMLWRSDWKLSGNFTVSIEAEIHGLNPGPSPGEDPSWQMFDPGYGFLGICWSGQELTESYNQLGRALVAGWFEDGHFGIFQTQRLRHRYLLRDELHADIPFAGSEFIQLPPPRPGDKVTLQISVEGEGRDQCTLAAQLTVAGKTVTVKCENVDRRKYGDGYVGVSGRGLFDFSIHHLKLEPRENHALTVGIAECTVCYPLGDSLHEENGQWKVRFIGLFRTGGEQASIRISDQEHPQEGWSQVPVAGSAPILSGLFRCNTAVIETLLPENPARKTLYYTVWKGGRNVTSDPRIGTRAVGRGTGLLSQAPSTGDYVGRLPRLSAPYRVSLLSCHRIHDPNYYLGEDSDKKNCELIMDQPWPESFQHFGDYDFQVLLWEDDVWYLEYPIFPPSPDDAYKSISFHIGGPCQRWQMMRHWNMLNAGDHDYGLDDIQGPSQYAVRFHEDLTQDAEYLRRNMQIVAHLMLGDENPDPRDTPRLWRHWKFPDRDFSLVTVDCRLWKSTPDQTLWDQEGWGHNPHVYDRFSPLRTLLGDEQTAWLQETLHADSSTMICVSGINVLNTIYNQLLGDPVGPERDFVLFDANCHDFAGWHAAPTQRLLDLFGSREGIITVYGDLHHAGISRNVEHRVIEAHAGPTGNAGYLRSMKNGFGPRMKGFNGEDVEVIGLYHQFFESPHLTPRPQREDGRRDAQNFMEMEFDTREAAPTIRMRIRHLLDHPDDAPRGGVLEEPLDQTGRPPDSRLPDFTTLPLADVVVYDAKGRPLRGLRSRKDGAVPRAGLTRVAPGTEVTVVTRQGSQVDSRTVKTLPA